ncbi:WD repeat-containing protein 63 [Dufourea novaeangliae]|uniref:WD repeat-containing protein 63 n=1 Tax=Dufourea novaeangliae TaxID=178035 RepID=A0A154PF50_DUFNO|nr:WD repeat-containing protein 63 [Dufourea novaeangliae]
MPRKGVKCPSGWTLLDENIENVERVRLDLESQRELGCVVGVHVFLEYPWAYVNRDIVVRCARLTASPLAAFKKNIEAYEAETFLIGYSSDRLASENFVICLTEQAKRIVVKRNRNIAKMILNKVLGKVRKTVKPWKLLGSESEVDESFARDTRQLFEIEIEVPGRSLFSARKLSDRGSNDSKDSYVELVNANEEFRNVEKKCISRPVQTHLQPRETFVQTYRGYLRNAWTQYAYVDTLHGEFLDRHLAEGNVESKEESEQNDDQRSKGKSDVQESECNDEPREKTPLDLFLEARSLETIDTVKYNAAVNLHIDDIENLFRSEPKIQVFSDTPIFREPLSFVDLNFTRNEAVSDISLHQKSTDYVAISYVTGPTRSPAEKKLTTGQEFRSVVLVWKFDDPLVPWLRLQDHREISSVSFCPYDDRFVIGGCSSGRVVIWDIKDHLTDGRDDKNINVPLARKENRPVVRGTIVSDKNYSHHLAVRRIQWMPANYRIEPNGKLRKSSISSEAQFLTASEDGTVAVWNLSTLSGVPSVDDDNSDTALQPILRFRIGVSNEIPRNFLLLCLCLPSIGILQERNANHRETHELNSNEKYYAKCLWIGCAEGLIKCTWDEQIFDGETLNTVQCKLLNRSYVHDGPVTDIIRSPHIQDVFLTIGGHVFAIWKDDYLDSPLFWRRTCRRYTACCWASEPGVFLLGNNYGELELWDIKNESSEPISSQSVSSKSITRLISFDRSIDSESVKMIGVGDEAGFFRAFRERDPVRIDETVQRMDWFEEYVWREARRKKVFSSWQNDFLRNDPAAIAKISARRGEERKKELEEARAKLRKEEEERSKSKAEKSARGVPKSKHVAWISKEYERTKQVLLKKKNLDPADLEAKRLPLVVAQMERNAKLKRVQDTIDLQETYFSEALAVQLSESLVESKNSRPTAQLKRSTDGHATKSFKIRAKLFEMLAKNSVTRKS